MSCCALRRPTERSVPYLCKAYIALLMGTHGGVHTQAIPKQGADLAPSASALHLPHRPSTHEPACRALWGCRSQRSMRASLSQRTYLNWRL